MSTGTEGASPIILQDCIFFGPTAYDENFTPIPGGTQIKKNSDTGKFQIIYLDSENIEHLIQEWEPYTPPL